MERIGVVLVHGVGEQGRFEHLSNEVRDLLTALDANPDLRCTVDTRRTRDSAVQAEQESWLAETGAPIRVDITYVGGEHEGQCKSLDIHEVWWADLDDKATLWNRVNFWFWGLGMWNAKRFRDAHLPGSQNGMAPPKPNGGPFRNLWPRAALFGFAVFFLLTAVTLEVLNAALRVLRLGRIGRGVLYRYVGDVKLYQDRGRPGEGPLEDRGLPRRVAIRRRMVTALVSAARSNYDRWYVLGHSLGSVVAFNGLMETAHALPNYLSKKELDQAQAFTTTDQEFDSGHVACMSPRRPVWIKNKQLGMDRQCLFRNLRGFVTYGSPLDKFAFLWPQIVNVNNDRTAFSEGFEWINLFDHSDPVAGRLDAFREAFGPNRGPRNLAYKACWALLWSHNRYLKGGCRNDSAARRLLDWMLEGSTFQCPAPGRGSSWYGTQNCWFGIALRLSMWLPLAALQLAIVGWLSAWLVFGCAAVWPEAAAIGGIAAVGVVLVVGLVRRPVEALIDWSAASCLRRRHLKTGLLVVLALVIAVAASYAYVRVTALEVKCITDDVWMLRNGLWGNVAVLRTGGGAVVVDTEPAREGIKDTHEFSPITDGTPVGQPGEPLRRGHPTDPLAAQSLRAARCGPREYVPSTRPGRLTITRCYEYTIRRVGQ